MPTLAQDQANAPRRRCPRLWGSAERVAPAAPGNRRHRRCGRIRVDLFGSARIDRNRRLPGWINGFRRRGRSDRHRIPRPMHLRLGIHKRWRWRRRSKWRRRRQRRSGGPWHVVEQRLRAPPGSAGSNGGYGRGGGGGGGATGAINTGASTIGSSGSGGGGGGCGGVGGAGASGGGASVALLLDGATPMLVRVVLRSGRGGAGALGGAGGAGGPGGSGGLATPPTVSTMSGVGGAGGSGGYGGQGGSGGCASGGPSYGAVSLQGATIDPTGITFAVGSGGAPAGTCAAGASASVLAP